LSDKKRIKNAGVGTPVWFTIVGVRIIRFVLRKKDDMFRQRKGSKSEALYCLGKVSDKCQISTRRVTKKSGDADIHESPSQCAEPDPVS
jgi:hypothetical protein